MVESLHWCAGLESNQRCFSVGDLQSLALATRHTDAYLIDYCELAVY